ncbi:MAG: hypothetical protein GF329_01570, partial [Candidatus Lokiarchaeota archaeon]|nr:hypothetical protein [Candidatus Lokiarchaeota archaeon]
MAMYITANDSADNINVNNNSGNYFNYTINDLFSPLIKGANLTNPPVTYNKSINITISLYEPLDASGLDTVLLIYHDGIQWNNLTMSRYQGNEFDGNYTALIPPQHWNTSILAYFYFNDTSGNWKIDDNSSNYYELFVMDLWGPIIGPITNNITKTASPEEIVEINTTIIEPIVPKNASGVNQSILSFQNQSGWFNISMNLIEGDIYNGVWRGYIAKQVNGLTVNYTIYAQDRAANWERSSIYSYLVSNTNYTLLLNATIFPPDEKLSVTAYFEFKNGTPIDNALCSFSIRNQSGELQAKADDTNASGIATVTFGFGQNYADGVYELWSTAVNSTLKVNNTANTTFLIQRYIRPIIGEPTYIPNIPAYNQTCQVNVSIEVSPAFGYVDTAILWYLHPSLGWQSISMTNTTYNSITGIGHYNATIPAFDYNEIVASYIWANDTRGKIEINNNSGLYYNYTITDHWGPTVETPVWTSPVSYIDLTNVTVRIYDDPSAINNASGIDVVLLYYFDGLSWNQIQMNQINGTSFDAFYNVSIPALSFGTSAMFYIFANDSANNQIVNNNSGSNFTYLIEDYWGPSISEITLNNPPIIYNMTASITCRVQEPSGASGVDFVILSYNDGSWNNITMDLLSGNNSDGIYNASIPSLPYNTNVQYYIWTNDSSSNPSFDDNSGLYYSYLVEDHWGPSISEITLNDPLITYNITANITCRVQEPTDASGVDVVILSYNDGSNWNNITMNLLSGNNFDGIYNASIPNLAYNTNVQYYIWTNDSSSNPSFDDNSGSYYSYLVEDHWGPSISEITLNNPPITYNMTANITCWVQEPSGASGVNVVILSYNNGSDWNNITMDLLSGDSFDGIYNGSISFLDYNTNVQYYVWTNDSAGNDLFDDNSSAYYSYLVEDHWGPNIQDPIQNDTIIEYTESVGINIRLTEPTIPANASGVQNVILSYWNGTDWNNITMTRFDGDIRYGNYTGTIPRTPYGVEVAYKIYAEDIAGNWAVNDNNTELFNYTSVDITAPTVSLTNPPSESVIAGDYPFEITDTGEIDTDVNNITLTYSYNTSGPFIYGVFIDGSNFTWNSGGITNISVNTSELVLGSNYTFTIVAGDLRGLSSLSSSIYNITVSNYTGPMISNIYHTPTPPIYNQTTSVYCNVQVPESFGNISTVLLHYYESSWNQIEMTNSTSKIPGETITYTASIPAFNWNTTISYWIFANDTNINETIDDNHGLYYNYTIRDIYSPQIEIPQYSLYREFNESQSVQVDVSDQYTIQESAGVSQVYCVFWNGTGWESILMSRDSGDKFDGTYSAIIESISFGITGSFYIMAVDFDGNLAINNNSDQFYNYTITDSVEPVINDPIYDVSATYSETVNVSVRVEEPHGSGNQSGIDTVLCYYYTGSVWDFIELVRTSGNQFNGTYNGSIPAQAYGTHSLYIWANDTENNININDNNGEYFNYSVSDPDPPTIPEVLIDSTVAYNETMNVTVRVTELLVGSGVDEVKIYYYDMNAWYNLSATSVSGDLYNGYYQAFIPIQILDNNISVAIWAIDNAGRSVWNNNSGNYYNYTVIDPYPPVIENVTIRSENGDLTYEYWEIAYLEKVDLYEPIEASGISTTNAAKLSFSIDLE